MSLRTKFWLAIAVLFGPILIGFATPESAPAWVRAMEDGVLLVEAVLIGLLLLAVLVTPARVLDRVAKRLAERAARRREPTIREVPAANGLQALSTFLRDGQGDDDPHAFARKYGLVRRIHGDDNASRLTREEIEAEYERYDRAETAASEERCQTCDPEHVPATHLVEAWDEQPGQQRYIGEWLLCTPHAEEKVTSICRTGASARSEPMVGGDIR